MLLLMWTLIRLDPGHPEIDWIACDPGGLFVTWHTSVDDSVQHLWSSKVFFQWHLLASLPHVSTVVLLCVCSPIAINSTTVLSCAILANNNYCQHPIFRHPVLRLAPQRLDAAETTPQISMPQCAGFLGSALLCVT